MIECVLNYTLIHARKRVKLDEHWYDHVPKSGETSHEDMVTKLWNNRNNPNNKPDIIIHDNKKGTCTIIDVAIPRDS
jgi:hypothetical protein